MHAQRFPARCTALAGLVALTLVPLSRSTRAQSSDLAALPGENPAELASWLFAAGSGGPGGNFDWCVPAGQTLILDTASTLLTGGPHCSGTMVQQVVGGLVEARNVSIGPGAIVRVIGPNPLVVFASGTVRIEGTLDLSGISSQGVGTHNTTTLPEPGAPGQAGGGAGGMGNPIFTAPCPKGGNGFGAFGAVDGGGAGGETGWNNITPSQLDGRRGAGGGGGGFGANQAQTFGPVGTFGAWDQSFIGLDGEQGFSNDDPNANGALSGAPGPFGGSLGRRPFKDADPLNDFWGFGIAGSGLVVQGELDRPWAGAGGGGGGNASFVPNGGQWPQVPFNPVGDEKGAGGAGGGGSLQIFALGDIVFGQTGLILCRGGLGGGGENTLYLNRVGGGSGGGSGGHVILQTAGVIDFSLSLGPSTQPGELAGGILATGGQGGAGKGDKGGAFHQPGGMIQTPPFFDACPDGYPPVSGLNGCTGHIDGAGGDGSPGLIQLHTRYGLDPSNPSILLPPGKTIADVCKPLPVGSDGSVHLVPRFPGYPGDQDALAGQANTDASSWATFLHLRPGEGLLQHLR